jgi:hypothetical protein
MTRLPPAQLCSSIVEVNDVLEWLYYLVDARKKWYERDDEQYVRGRYQVTMLSEIWERNAPVYRQFSGRRFYTCKVSPVGGNWQEEP